MNILFTLFVALCFVLTGCGGGGSDGVVPISIGAPDVSRTDLSEIYLSGTSFLPEGSFCYSNQTIPFLSIAGAYSITWENLANNQSGSAQIWPFCASEISWSVLPAIALVLGENQITATVTTDNGSWQDTITVTRVPDITPPVIISFTPEASSTGMYNGFISMTFNEPVDPDSLWTSFTLRNMTTNMSVTGVGTMDPLSPVFQPDTALDANTTYLVHIEGVVDLAGNILIEPFDWTFITGI